jgi:hypothetical protein
VAGEEEVLVRREGIYPRLFFVSADSKEVKKAGFVTAEYKGVEVPLESADTGTFGNCRIERSCEEGFL